MLKCRYRELEDITDQQDREDEDNKNDDEDYEADGDAEPPAAILGHAQL